MSEMAEGSDLNPAGACRFVATESKISTYISDSELVIEQQVPELQVDRMH
jgi:hypothetical protein